MTDDTSRGYELSRLEERVQSMQIKHATETTSTNDWARQQVETGKVQAPVLFVAETQSAGRGRGTNTWWSHRGNITATFVMPQNPHIAFGLVPLLAGLAVRRGLVNITGCDEIALKWPNDLVVGMRKVAGLLCERLQHVDLIGVGVNINAGSSEAPAELKDQITSMHELSGKQLDLTTCLGEISREIHCLLSLDSEAAAREAMNEYTKYHQPTGNRIELIDTDDAPSITGRCGGIDLQGRLIVETPNGTRTLLTGSIASIEPM